MVSCNNRVFVQSFEGSSYVLGFGVSDIAVEDPSSLYIAGYHNGWEAEGLLDNQQARAVWLGTGEDGILLMSVDCIGLGSDTVERIRKAVDVPNLGIIVCSTHDHAGADTLGLWGPVAIDGKDPGFMENLVQSCREAARQAYSSAHEGRLFYGEILTEGMQSDSRDPVCFDRTMRVLRFVPNDGSAATRIVCFAAHAESLRGANRMLSRDWPGAMADIISKESGENCLFLNGAIGGLVLTPVLSEEPFDAVDNMLLTGASLASYALSCDCSTEVEPSASYVTKAVDIPLDNTLYMYYRFLGILGNSMKKGKSGTGYVLKSSVSVLSLGDVNLVLIPGEMFPEMYDDLVPDDGIWIAAGLANDEIGYVVDPSSFVLDDRLPFIESVPGHYEETNSCGVGTYDALKKAFEELNLF